MKDQIANGISAFADISLLDWIMLSRPFLYPALVFALGMAYFQSKRQKVRARRFSMIDLLVFCTLVAAVAVYIGNVIRFRSPGG